MPRSLIHRFAAMARCDVVYETERGDLTPYLDSPADSPLVQDGALRDNLREGLASNGTFYLYQDPFHAYYLALAYQGGRLYLGPLCNSQLNPAQRARFYESHRIHILEHRALRTLTLRQIKDTVVLAVSLFCGIDLPEEDLFSPRPAEAAPEQAIQQDLQDMLRDNEAYADEGLYRHTYHEEQLLLKAVQAGSTDEAIRIAENMDGDSGRFAAEELQHFRILAAVAITLVARAAISGGILPEDAYRISGYYIRKSAAAQVRRELLYYRNRCIQDFCTQIQTLRQKKTGTSYTVMCRDYIRKHYREKIYVEDIAAPLGISPDYLSRLFRKEMGVTIQAYINQVRVERAAELLVYSEQSLPAIAAYVHFPSQSYFGRIFKQIKGQTPSEYRKALRVPEFWMDAPGPGKP